jgi:hypothetical protein
VTPTATRTITPTPTTSPPPGPTTVTLVAVADSYLDSRSGYQDTNYGTSADLYVRGSPVRALARFDLSSLPAGATVISASLQLYKRYGVAEDGRAYTANRVTGAWTETGVTWRRRDATTLWATPGGEYTAVGAASTVLPDGAVWVSWDVTGIVQGWAGGAQPNYGFLVRDAAEDGSANRYSIFRSREYAADPSLRPRLVVALMPPTPTATPTATATWTPTWTPTSHPGPPILYEPADGATLPQPVPPGEWLFRWSARTGPCTSGVGIRGPGGRHIGSGPISGGPLEYRYTSDEYLPDDALGPWTWGVGVTCPLGTNQSETRTFWVERAPTPTATPTSTATLMRRMPK